MSYGTTGMTVRQHLPQGSVEAVIIAVRVALPCSVMPAIFDHNQLSSGLSSVGLFASPDDGVDCCVEVLSCIFRIA